MQKNGPRGLRGKMAKILTVVEGRQRKITIVRKSTEIGRRKIGAG